MLFNSNVFLLFFAGFLLAYYLVRGNLRRRNVLIVAASYLFYGWWDCRFLALLLVSTFLDYSVGIGIEKSAAPAGRRRWLALSVAGNLALLGFFKYFDFFAGSLGVALGKLGVPYTPRALGIILPVGISFYTFQTMSYSFDVYRGSIRASRDPIAYMAYVTFFPQLVAGPIERGRHLLPQFGETRTITRGMVEEGIWLSIWGMFKKVVLADNLGRLADMVYGAANMSGPMVVLGTIAFGFQIYCDFSGYSDIARGTARILGFDIMVNFDLPYVARNIRDFWRRWHVSLSTWLRDYLYVSLGGNRGGRARTYANIMVTMLLGGLWHGAAWHYVVWGAWHGAGLVIHRIVCSGVPLGRRLPPGRPGAAERRPCTSTLVAGLSWFGTMSFVFYGWLLFRAGSMQQVATMTMALADLSFPPWVGTYALCLAAFCLPLVLMQTWQARTGDLLAPLRLPIWGRALLQGALLIAIMLYWGEEAVPFIYFQF